MKKKRTFYVVVTVMMFFSLLLLHNPKSVDAASNVAGGECGSTMEWYLSTEGVLTIEGSGTMNNWSWSDKVPWHLYRDQIKKVVIKKGVTDIGHFAFRDCHNLTAVELPNTITVIGGDAFRNCTALKSISLPSAVTDIGGWAFQDCAIKSINLGSNLRAIGMGAFRNSGLTSITVPASIQNTNGYLFEDCDDLVTAKIGIGTGTYKIGYQDFYGCDKLETVIIGDGVNFIDRYAFSDCGKLRNLTIGKNVKTIRGAAFGGCTSLTEVVLPDSLENLMHGNWGDGPFENCANLKKVVFGTGIKRIAGNAFKNSTSISEIYFCGDAPVFEGTNTFAVQRLLRIIQRETHPGDLLL